MVGNPLIQCYTQDEPEETPCVPSPCGAGAQCSVVNNRAICSCLPDYLGDPQSGCRPECVLNSDCPPDKSCINKRCENACIGSICGINAECRVSYHTATCSCANGYMGDAFIHCLPITNTTTEPCNSDPCGSHNVCNVYGNNVALCDPCAGPNSYNNPQCRPECLSNTDCPFDKACIRNKCQDPCPGVCGANAICSVINHNPLCTCPQGLYGNPFVHCSVIEEEPETCNTIQCGPNAECRQQNGVLACVCLKDYYGDPLIGCRPECVINPDCPSDKACANLKCVNPCLGACGVNALCQVVNHVAVCYCQPDYTGDALVACVKGKQNKT